MKVRDENSTLNIPQCNIREQIRQSPSTIHAISDCSSSSSAPNLTTNLFHGTGCKHKECDSLLSKPRHNVFNGRYCLRLLTAYEQHDEYSGVFCRLVHCFLFTTLVFHLYTSTVSSTQRPSSRWQIPGN